MPLKAAERGRGAADRVVGYEPRLVLQSRERDRVRHVWIHVPVCTVDVEMHGRQPLRLRVSCPSNVAFLCVVHAPGSFFGTPT